MTTAGRNIFAWHRSLIFKLIVVVLLCVAVAQGLVLYLTTQQDDEIALTHFKEHHQNVLSAHSEIFGSLVWRLQFDRLDRVMQSLMAEPAVIFVRVSDITGAVVAKAKRNDEADQSAAVRLTSDIKHSNDFIDTIAGSVEIGLTTQFLSEDNQNKFRDKLLIFLFSAVSIVVGTLLAAKKLFSTPLAQLNHAIERTKLGERGIRMPPRETDEVGVLFESFNGFMQTSEQYRDVINSANLRLTALALRDELTGLFNRRAALEKFKALRDEPNISVIFIDVDHFKTINDLYGHDGGDALLRSLAERISTHIDSATSSAYRIGGDEFIVLQEGLTSAEAAHDAANKLLADLTGSYSAKSHEQHISVSIGVYFCEASLSSFDEVVAMTSRALRSAKASGRNRTVLLDQDLREEAIERITLARSVQDALERRSFETYFQTRHVALTGEIVGAEALSRCIMPDGSIIGPAHFMPLIEETHHSLEHGQILVEQICSAIQPLQENFGESFRISLNVNAHQLIHPEFWTYFERERKKYGLPTSAFEVEITESSLIQNFSIANEVLQQFREDGGIVALDDFGTGYSSLSYLTRLPIDIIKLDREFAASAVRDRRNAGILQSTILLANSIGAQVVAEGIETVDEEIFMRSAGVNYLQGFRYSRPSPLNQVLQLANGKMKNETKQVV